MMKTENSKLPDAYHLLKSFPDLRQSAIAVIQHLDRVQSPKKNNSFAKKKKLFVSDTNHSSSYVLRGYNKSCLDLIDNNLSKTRQQWKIASFSTLDKVNYRYQSSNSISTNTEISNKSNSQDLNEKLSVQQKFKVMLLSYDFSRVNHVFRYFQKISLNYSIFQSEFNLLLRSVFNFWLTKEESYELFDMIYNEINQIDGIFTTDSKHTDDKDNDNNPNNNSITEDSRVINGFSFVRYIIKFNNEDRIKQTVELKTLHETTFEDNFISKFQSRLLDNKSSAVSLIKTNSSGYLSKHVVDDNLLSLHDSFPISHDSNNNSDNNAIKTITNEERLEAIYNKISKAAFLFDPKKLQNENILPRIDAILTPLEFKNILSNYLFVKLSSVEFRCLANEFMLLLKPEGHASIKQVFIDGKKFLQLFIKLYQSSWKKHSMNNEVLVQRHKCVVSKNQKIDFLPSVTGR